jgi:hypothetical protein
MLDWLKNLVNSCPWKRKTLVHCLHTNVKVDRWLENHTPMVEITCQDCGFHDRGPVYADNFEKWEL